MIGGFRSVLCVSVFQGSLPVIVIREFKIEERGRREARPEVRITI